MAEVKYQEKGESIGTEAFHERKIEDLKYSVKDFYDRAALSEIMFLDEALTSWETDSHTPTTRCLIADVMGAKLGVGTKAEESCQSFEVTRPSRLEAVLGLPEVNKVLRYELESTLIEDIKECVNDCTTEDLALFVTIVENWRGEVVDKPSDKAPLIKIVEAILSPEQEAA